MLYGEQIRGTIYTLGCWDSNGSQKRGRDESMRNMLEDWASSSQQVWSIYLSRPQPISLVSSITWSHVMKSSYFVKIRDGLTDQWIWFRLGLGVSIWLSVLDNQHCDWSEWPVKSSTLAHSFQPFQQLLNRERNQKISHQTWLKHFSSFNKNHWICHSYSQYYAKHKTLFISFVPYIVFFLLFVFCTCSYF